MTKKNEKRGAKTRRASKPKDGEPESLRKIDLSRQLGINRVTLDKYLNRDDAPKPDAHFRFRVEEVVAYVAKQRTEDAKIKGKSHWEAEKARLQCEAMVEEMARKRGDFVERKELERAIPPLVAELAELMRARFVRELPSRYKGRDTVECAQMNEAACDAIAERFRAGATAIGAS